MEMLVILALGLWLAAADWLAIETTRSRGRKVGLVVWLVAVLIPLAASLVFMSWKVALGAALVGTVLSGLAYWCKRQERLGSQASRLYSLL